jgi:hypothetical protein
VWALLFRAPAKQKRAGPELDQWQSDLDLRLKALEREHDDLHAAYRRIRATAAGEARQRVAPLAAADQGNGSDPGASEDPKHALRVKAARLLRPS